MSEEVQRQGKGAKHKILNFTVMQYFNYLVFLGSENGKLQEAFMKNAELHYAVVDNAWMVKDDNEYIQILRSVVKEDCIADTAFVTLYNFDVTDEVYENLKKLFPKFQDRELILKMFFNLFSVKGAVRVTAAFPIVLSTLSGKSVVQ